MYDKFDTVHLELFTLVAHELFALVHDLLLEFAQLGREFRAKFVLDQRTISFLFETIRITIFDLDMEKSKNIL